MERNNTKLQEQKNKLFYDNKKEEFKISILLLEQRIWQIEEEIATLEEILYENTQIKLSEELKNEIEKIIKYKKKIVEQNINKKEFIRCNVYYMYHKKYKCYRCRYVYPLGDEKYTKFFCREDEKDSCSDGLEMESITCKECYYYIGRKLEDCLINQYINDDYEKYK